MSIDFWPDRVKVLTKRLRIDYPIIQAPMAGGPSTPELVAAVSNAQALGSLGAASQAYLRAGFGVMLGVMFLGEHITLVMALGIGAAITGVVLINLPRRVKSITFKS